MCTLVILRRPDHDWPLILGANRDEQVGRPWQAPGRHWPDRPEVIAGRDGHAGGSWLGLNDHGVIAAIMNRAGSLGPAPDKRSRGELVLEALDHADADAAAALADLDGTAYRPFNLVVADNRDAVWLRSDGTGTVRPIPLAHGISMLTAFDANDTRHARIRRYLPRFRAAAAPDPAAGDWSAWEALLAAREADGDGNDGAGPRGAMSFAPENGFGTLSGSLLALPAPGAEIPPVWRFCDGPPGDAPFRDVALEAAG